MNKMDERMDGMDGHHGGYGEVRITHETMMRINPYNRSQTPTRRHSNRTFTQHFLEKGSTLTPSDQAWPKHPKKVANPGNPL